MLQGKAEPGVVSCTFLSYLVPSQHSPVTCCNYRYVNWPSEAEGGTLECLSALLGQGHCSTFFVPRFLIPRPFTWLWMWIIVSQLSFLRVSCIRRAQKETVLFQRIRRC